jgi:hypothetical protein
MNTGHLLSGSISLMAGPIANAIGLPVQQYSGRRFVSDAAAAMDAIKRNAARHELKLKFIGLYFV